MVKILNVHHTGANTLYHKQVLDCMVDNYKDVYVETTGIGEYAEEGNPSDFDVVIYQTFPDEFHMGKFNPNLVALSDKVFKEFRGWKILACCHDNGEVDSYSRFNDPTIPRIKCFPTERFLDKFNVVLLSSMSLTSNIPVIFPDEFERKVKVSCKFGIRNYNHMVRQDIHNQLSMSFPDLADKSWKEGRRVYRNSKSS